LKKEENGKAFQGRQRLHTLSDLASLAKYPEVKRGSRRSRRINSYEQNRNAINLLPSTQPEEEKEIL